MKYSRFVKMIRAEGGSLEDAKRLNKEGFDSAYDAHIGLFNAGMMGISSEKDFISYCYFIGRRFVIDNLGDLFQLSRTA